MAGSPDFHPAPPRRAPDPSLEEMLRRAREARLGADAGAVRDHAWPAPAVAPPARQQPGRWLRDWLLVATGVVVGVLLSIGVGNVAATVSNWTAPAATAASVTTITPTPAVPTSTPTPLPTVTPLPTATVAIGVPPPTTDEISTLAQDFYDNQGPFAGSYVLLDVTDLQIQSQDESQLAVCISYEAATVAAPDTVAASNTRLFTLAATSDGSWQVVEMGSGGSCYLS